MDLRPLCSSNFIILYRKYLGSLVCRTSPRVHTHAMLEDLNQDSIFFFIFGVFKIIYVWLLHLYLTTSTVFKLEFLRFTLKSKRFILWLTIGPICQKILKLKTDLTHRRCWLSLSHKLTLLSILEISLGTGSVGYKK